LSGIGTGWQRCFISAYTSGVEDKKAWFSAAEADEESLDIQ